MDRLNKDELFTLGLHLDLPDLITFCKLNKKFASVCPNVWRAKIAKDFPEFKYETLTEKMRHISLADFYSVLHARKVLDLNRNKLEELYFTKYLDLSHWGLTKVPVFYLPNLISLSLSYNKLNDVPRFDLPNLEILHLNNNQLTIVPDFELPNLKKLYLYGNLFTEEEKIKINKKYGLRVLL